MRQLFLLSCLLVAFLPIIQTSAQESECTNPIDFWYDGNTATLHFVNPNTHEFIGIAGEHLISYQRHGFSPDCRYIGATLIRRVPVEHFTCYGQYQIGRKGDIAIWDALTGQLVGEYPDNRYSRSGFSWNPYGTQVVFETCDGGVLWDFRDNRLLALTDALAPGAALVVTWSENPAEVYTLERGYNVGMFSEDLVYSFNWQSFSPVFTYVNRVTDDSEGCNYHGYKVLSDFVLVYCSGSYDSSAPISIWDIHSHQLLYQVNGLSAGVMGLAGSPDRIALSPDNHYLVIGYQTLRVWDLWNLPSDFAERSRDYQYSIGGVAKSVQFIDNTTVEILLNDNTTIIRMNILTGEILE